MASRYRAIYAEKADDYDRLISAEDCDRQLAAALARVCDLTGRTAIEIGAGTGRVTEILLAAGARVIATEPSSAMIGVARRKLGGAAGFARGDAWRIPCRDDTADLAVAGWVIGHFREWYPADWMDRCARALAEMARVVSPGGSIAVIESLGTGQLAAAAPSPELAQLHRELEARHGFHCDVIHTDYQFPDVDTAASILGGFFGDAMAARVRDRGWTRVPEWTGVWSRAVG